MRERHILIAGAGLGGLAAAAGLQRQGFKVSVFEQARQLGEIGAGIMLTPNAIRALESVGALAAVEPRGVEPEKASSWHYKTGELLGERLVKGAYEAEYGRPTYNIHRADLHRALADTVRAYDPDAIHTGHRIVDVVQDANEVEARFENGVVARGDALIGADGIRSVVRHMVTGEDSPPQFTNFVAWRGLVPLTDLPEHMRGSSMMSWVSDDRHIIEYAVGPLKNYVALAQPADTGWRSESWSTPSSVDELLEVFHGWHEDITTLLKATPADGSFKFALHDRDPLTNWTRGRVTLLGDAAHPMLPLMAQGSAMALEDAAVLARAFAAADDVEEALTRYQAARMERTTWTQLESRAVKDAYEAVNKGDWQARGKRRMDFLYSYDPDTVAV